MTKRIIKKVGDSELPINKSTGFSEIDPDVISTKNLMFTTKWWPNTIISHSAAETKSFMLDSPATNVSDWLQVNDNFDVQSLTSYLIEKKYPHPFQTHITKTRQKTETEEEGEKTRQFISEKIEYLKDELSNKTDLLEAQKEIIQKITDESKEIRRVLKQEIVELTEQITDMNLQIAGLQSNVSRFLPHKRVYRVSVYFVTFFLISIIFQNILGIKVMDNLWEWVGLAISTSFLCMSYFMFLDWKETIKSS
jgi:hypothetical protein